MQSELESLDGRFKVNRTDDGGRIYRMNLILNGGVDETRTRDLLRDRQAF
jgi:hypothetical protein